MIRDLLYTLKCKLEIVVPHAFFSRNYKVASQIACWKPFSKKFTFHFNTFLWSRSVYKALFLLWKHFCVINARISSHTAQWFFPSMPALITFDRWLPSAHLWVILGAKVQTEMGHVTTTGPIRTRGSVPQETQTFSAQTDGWTGGSANDDSAWPCPAWRGGGRRHVSPIWGGEGGTVRRLVINRRQVYLALVLLCSFIKLSETCRDHSFILTFLLYWPIRSEWNFPETDSLPGLESASHVSCAATHRNMLTISSLRSVGNFHHKH